MILLSDRLQRVLWKDYFQTGKWFDVMFPKGLVLITLFFSTSINLDLGVGICVVKLSDEKKKLAKQQTRIVIDVKWLEWDGKSGRGWANQVQCVELWDPVTWRELTSTNNLPSMAQYQKAHVNRSRRRWQKRQMDFLGLQIENISIGMILQN